MILKNSICICIFLLITHACLNQLAAQNVLNQDDVYLVDSIGNNSVCFHKNMNLVDSIFHPQIIENIKQGVELTDEFIDFTNVEFRVMVFPERTIPRLGMSGVAPNTKHIYILLDPHHPKIEEAINKHIVQTIPHEYHHTIRYRTVGFGSNLFEALISEGLACHFAMQVCNTEAPEYCVAYNDQQIDERISKAEAMWFNEEYDYFDWFVGRTKPRNIGYALGYRLVANYIDQHPGSSASSLSDVPAIQFIPNK